MKTVKLIAGILVLLVFLTVNMSYGQWATSGSNIYNTNAGNVGIGINTPGYLLHVAKNMTSPSIRIQNTGGTGGAAFEMIDNLSGADWKFKATTTGGFKIRDHAAGLDVIQVEPGSMANAFYINAAGNVGFGTSTPGYKLDVVGNDIALEESYPFLYLNSTLTGGNAGINFTENDVDNGWIFYDESEDVLRFNASSGSGYRNDLIIKADGRVCIGTTTAATGYALNVNGKAVCTEVLVEALASWPDYVFSKDYELLSLRELDKSIKTSGHLPGIPSAAEIEKNGILLGDMQTKLLLKIEELTLYTIEQDRKIEELQKKVEALEKESK